MEPFQGISITQRRFQTVMGKLERFPGFVGRRPRRHRNSITMIGIGMEDGRGNDSLQFLVSQLTSNGTSPWAKRERDDE